MRSPIRSPGCPGSAHGLWQQDLRRLPPAKRYCTGLLRVLAHLFVSASQNLAACRPPA